MAQHGDFGDTSVTVCSLSGWVGGRLHYFPSSFSISSTCQVGHLDLESLLSHISSNFCDIFAGRYKKWGASKLVASRPLFRTKICKRQTAVSDGLCGISYVYDHELFSRSVEAFSLPVLTVERT